MKKVTIMIPTYNQINYIEQAINSALMQDYPNIEIIISDDSIDNNTKNMIDEKYCNFQNIKYFHNNPSLGRVQNYRKTLYERATGEYVLNLDGDDWLIDKMYISKAVEILNTSEDIVCVIGNQVTFNNNSSEFVYNKRDKSKDLKKINDGNELFLVYPEKQISLNHLSNIYRRLDAMKINFYRMDTRSSDRESIFRLILDRKVGYIDTVVGAWRFHGKNASDPKNKLDRYNDLKFIDSVYSYAVKNSTIDKKKLDIWFKNMKFMDIYIMLYHSMRNFNIKQFFKINVLVLKKDRNLFFSLFPRLLKTIWSEHIFKKLMK